MGTNVIAFNKQLELASAKLVGSDLVIFHKKIIFELLERIVNNTPVDTGRLRGGWQTTVGTTTESKGSPSKAGSGPFLRAEQALAQLKEYDVVHISNNVAYVRFVEEGTGPGGFSDQLDPGGVGMVAIALQEVELMFAA